MAGFKDKETYELWMKRLDMMGFNSMNQYYAAIKQWEIDPDKLVIKRQEEIDKILNLITDITLNNATEDELKRAVLYSAVLIDAEKHHLDWQKAYKDLEIDKIKLKYYSGRYEWNK